VSKTPCEASDPELWFVDDSDREAVEFAKSLCRTCPVMDACREAAFVTRQDWGIWGATTARERAAIRKAGAA
jgi:hypothetical protein